MALAVAPLYLASLYSQPKTKTPIQSIHDGALRLRHKLVRSPKRERNKKGHSQIKQNKSQAERPTEITEEKNNKNKYVDPIKSCKK